MLIVSERENRNGIFDCYLADRYLCSSPSPLIDGCRALLAQGYNPAARVVMRHAGSTDDALRGILANVAGGHHYEVRSEAKKAGKSKVGVKRASKKAGSG